MRHRQGRTGMVALVLALVLPAAAGAESLWDKYLRFWDQKLEEVSNLDLYGLSAQLPPGIFSFKVDWNGRTAAGRFDRHKARKPMVQPIEFGDEKNPILSLDLGASGAGGGVTLQFSHSITGNMDFYFELPFQYMDVQMRPKLKHFDPGYCELLAGTGCNKDWFSSETADFGQTKERYLNEASAWLLNFLPQLGRPVLLDDPTDYPEDLGPGKAYHSNGLVLADINCGFSWNFFRNARWSGALTGRVFFPTGNVADPNNALTLGTGPEIDRGVGAFGVGMTQDYDLRIFKYGYWVDIVLSAELTTTYRFMGHRRYPDFPKPTTLGNTLLDQLDPGRAYFPDMADLTGKSYEITPGFSTDASVGLSVSVLIFDFSASIGYGYFQEPELNADPRFETMVRNLEMQAAGHLGAFKLAAGVNLIPFYVPLQIHYQYQRDIDGQNMIYFTKNHWVTIKGYLPTIF